MGDCIASLNIPSRLGRRLGQVEPYKGVPQLQYNALCLLLVSSRVNSTCHYSWIDMDCFLQMSDCALLQPERQVRSQRAILAETGFNIINARGVQISMFRQEPTWCPFLTFFQGAAEPPEGCCTGEGGERRAF